MKTYRLILITCLALAVIGIRPANAQDLAVAYDASSKQTLMLAVQPLRDEHDLFGFRGLDVQVSGIGGLGSNLTGGFAATVPLSLTKETALNVGLFWRIEQGQAAHGGVLAWLSRRF